MGKSFEAYIKACIDCLKKLTEEVCVKNVAYCFQVFILIQKINKSGRINLLLFENNY